MPEADFLPPALLEHLASLLPEGELSEFIAALRNPPTGVRANTLKIEPSELRAALAPGLEPLPYPPEGFSYRGEMRLGKHPYHAAGLYYMQDPGAICIGALVDPQPGERVLDLAAAPGGKTTHLAARMQNQGVLIANDPSRPRARELVSNLERLGVRNTAVLADRVERLGAHFGAWFDRVLLDAPCSGESMFHKSAAAREAWSEAVVAGCARRQGELLRDAARLVRPGGVLFYSTCTFSRAENEEVVLRFLEEEPEFVPTRLAAIPGAQGVGIAAPDGEEGALRLWPHHVPGAGHFVAALRRDGGGVTAELREARLTPVAEAVAGFREFLATTYPDESFEDARLESIGEELYTYPEGLPSLNGLSIVRPGFWCGSWKRRRFEPAHALALALPGDGASAPVRLDLEDERVERFLQGHPIEAPGRPGWTPVLVEGHALGWGKRVGKVVKNHYPKGLRWT